MFKCHYVINNMQPVIMNLKSKHDNKVDKENDIMRYFVTHNWMGTMVV